MSCRLGRILGFLLIAGLAVGAWQVPTDEEIAKAIRQLGDDDFATRETASQFLWLAGKAAEPQLKQALNNPDAEIKSRAKKLLDKLRFGVSPDTPKDIADLITRYRAADSNGKLALVQELLKKGLPGYQAVLRFAEGEENLADRQAVQQHLERESRLAAAALIAEGNAATAEELLEKTATAGIASAAQNFAVYTLLRGRVDEKIAKYRPLAGEKGSANAAQVLAHLCRARGDLAAARKAAEKSFKPDLIETVLFELGDWQELIRQATPNGNPPTQIRLLSSLVAHQRLAGNADGFAKSLATIKKFAEDGQPQSASAWTAAQVQFMNDRPQDAFALLAKAEARPVLFELLASQLKYREAFELADKALKEAGADKRDMGIHKASTLALLGETDQARKLFAELAGDLNNLQDFNLIARLIGTEYRAGLRDEALEHAALVLKRHVAGSNTSSSASNLFEQMFPQKGGQAVGCWAVLMTGDAAGEQLPKLKRIAQMMRGRAPAAELDAFLKQALDPAHPGEARLAHLGEICQTAGRLPQAQDYFERSAAKTPTVATLLRLGDFFADQKDWKQAAERYGQAWEKDKTQPLSLYLRGWALKRLGRDKEGQELADLAHLLPLADMSIRYYLADELAQRGLVKEALAERRLLVQFDSYESRFALNPQRFSGEGYLAAGDYARAADCQERFRLRMLRSNATFTVTPGYLIVPHRVHVYRARMLLEQGKVDEALKEAQVCSEFLSGDTRLAIMLVPQLEKRGRKADADKLYEAESRVLLQAAADYPRGAQIHNNLAWLAVRCRRQLDLALEHARKAVELAPETSGYFDTLAETYFQRGDKDKAIETMKKCIALEPKRDYYQRQLKRMEAGDPRVEPPAEGGN
jgi:tetratricopeptide (TPR) repeat protein